MARRLKFIDLFAGLGGFHQALTQMGHKCVFACEINEDLRDLYKRHYDIEPAGDIRSITRPKIQIDPHDILCAGFPCQPFSKAGAQLGTACPTNGDLFERGVLRIIRAHKPTYLILENVPNLERQDGGRTYQLMKSQLERLGYAVDQKVLSPHRFGIPQIRERLFIVGCRRGLNHFEWVTSNGRTPSIHKVLDRKPKDARPIPQHYVECLDVWQEFLDLYPDDEQLPSFPIWSFEFGADYPFEDEVPFMLSSRRLRRYRATHGQRLDRLPPSERMLAIPSYARGEELFPKWKQDFIRQNRELYARHRKWIKPWMKRLNGLAPSLQKFEWNCKGESRDLSEHVLQFRASGIRVKRSTSAPALVAMTTTQVPVIAAQKRFMTVKECSRLQGLEHLEHLETVAPTRAYKWLGNAVNADLVKIVAGQLIRTKGRGASSSKSRTIAAVTHRS